MSGLFIFDARYSDEASPFLPALSPFFPGFTGIQGPFFWALFSFTFEVRPLPSHHDISFERAPEPGFLEPSRFVSPLMRGFRSSPNSSKCISDL